MRRQIPIREQNARRAALDAIAATRQLSPAEAAERESLANRLYCRTWRQKQNEAERALRRRHHAA